MTRKKQPSVDFPVVTAFLRSKKAEVRVERDFGGLGPRRSQGKIEVGEML